MVCQHYMNKLLVDSHLLKKEKHFWKVKFVTKIPFSLFLTSETFLSLLPFSLLLLSWSLTLSNVSIPGKKKSTTTTATARSVTHPPPPDPSHSLFAISILSLVSAMAKALSSTTVSVSCAHRRHHHLYHYRSPFSLSAFGSTFRSFVFGCIWVALVNGFNLEREKLDNLAWVWNLGIWMVVFVDLKKKNKLKKYRLRKVPAE